MADSQAETVRNLLQQHGRSFCDELSINIKRNTPAPLFQLLCASLLLSARIGSDIAVSAAKALADAGWTTPHKLADSSWEDRTRVLNQAGYARYDEKTARFLADTTQLLLQDYDGDLRQLRNEAGEDRDREHELLKRFKGIGNVGADIFMREVQLVWNEVYPFADERVLKAAARLKLPDDEERLARLVDRQDLPRLAAALIRAGKTKNHV